MSREWLQRKSLTEHMVVCVCEAPGEWSLAAFRADRCATDGAIKHAVPSLLERGYVLERGGLLYPAPKALAVYREVLERLTAPRGYFRAKIGLQATTPQNRGSVAC